MTTPIRIDLRDPADEHAPRRLGRRGWVIVAASVVAVALLTVWLVGGLRPAVVATGDEGVVALSAKSSSSSDTSGHTWFTGSDGAFWLAVRNDGGRAVTLHGVDVDGNLQVRVRFAPGRDGDGAPVDSYTLQPGDEVPVRADLHVCGPVVSGSSVGVEQLALRATTWGLTRTVHVQASQLYGFFPQGVAALPLSKSCD